MIQYFKKLSHKSCHDLPGLSGDPWSESIGPTIYEVIKTNSTSTCHNSEILLRTHWCNCINNIMYYNLTVTFLQQDYVYF